MGCNSDYLNQTNREAELQLAASLYAYVLGQLKQAVPEDVKEAARDYYCKADFVAPLCEVLRSLPEGKRDAIVYKTKDATARKLATWWEAHLEADRERTASERAAKRAKSLRASGLAKLTLAEKRALGLDGLTD